MGKLEVVGLGQCCLDYLTLVDEYPVEDRKQEVGELLIQGGGVTATALVCLARLGRRTGLIGRVGEDRFGDMVRQGLMEEGVEVTHLKTAAGGTTQFAFILANPARASRTIFWTRGRGDGLELDGAPEDYIRGAKVLHLDGLAAEASLKAARLARRAGVEVSLDAGTLREHSLDLARQVDHLVVSEVFGRAYAPRTPAEEILQELHRLGPGSVVITLGAAGSVGFDGRRKVRMPAFKVRTVDTTGAGDAFHGGYIHGLLKGQDLEMRMRTGSAAAALCCTALGGRTALPDLKNLNDFLANNDRG